MKVLLTGASGFLGKAVMQRLVDAHDVVGLSHSQSLSGLAKCDIRDAHALCAVLDAHSPDIVVNSAAYRDPDTCEEDPAECVRLNVTPVETLCGHLPRETRVIQISTDYVFDGDSPPYTEESATKPLSEYGRSKVSAEHIVAQRTGSATLRIPVLVGAAPSLAESGYIGRLISVVREKNPSTLDDVHVRYPTWIEDVAQAIAFLIDIQAEGIFHCSGPTPGTQYAAAQEVAAVIGEDAGHLTPSTESVPRKAKRPRNSQLATDKIRALGFTRFTEFKDVVRHVVAAFD